MSWTSIAKPTGTSYTKINAYLPSFDEPNLSFDDANNYFDGLNTASWSKIAKPNNSWISIAKPT